ncbi:uncharacterized protein LOC134216520 isoform X2 [Armigeres subalbatus]|uniref:uncharacterized protein LOC134216520 isoform X2 n=1 Tax=Armigeres subalbatus TaxID=124917 RepID=UPI002ED672FE
MNKEAPDVLELSQGVTPLNLSTESGFYADWKQIYHVDTEQAILNPYPIDTIMPSITRLISTLCAQFRLSHTIEFSSIDTLEQFLIKVVAGGRGAPVRESYLQQMPMYAIYHSLLLGAVERFAKDHILTIDVVGKDHFGKVGVKLLRVVYAQKHYIYKSLRSRVSSEDMFVRFKSNKLILAAAIVMAILKLCGVDQQQVVDSVAETLSNECFVEAMNIIFLRDAILNVFNC